MKQIFGLIAELKLAPEPYKAFCLSNNDPYVLKDLARQKTNLENHKENAKAETSWQGNLLSLCHARGVQWTDCIVKPELQNDFFKAMGKRLQMSLGYNMLVRPNATSIDICQSVERAFVGHAGCLAACLSECQLPGCLSWLLAGRLAIRELALLEVQGHDVCPHTLRPMPILRRGDFDHISNVPCTPHGRNQVQPVLRKHVNDLIHVLPNVDGRRIVAEVLKQALQGLAARATLLLQHVAVILLRVILGEP
jgi:hypothetical protein